LVTRAAHGRIGHHTVIHSWLTTGGVHTVNSL